MAPVLSAAWAQGVAGASAELGGGQLALVGTVTAVSAFLLLSLLLLLCTGCQGQKKANALVGERENLTNGVSEREAFSQSVDSPATDMVASSSQNGPLTSGTVLSEDTLDTSPQPSEDMLSSQSELRSSKCPQDRELPSIPPSGGLEGAVVDPQASTGDGTYEVVKETASRDVSAEDSLYETVKELKEVESKALLNGASAPSPASAPPPLLNGGLSPATPDPALLSTGAEYASVDLNKKSRYSADMEGRRPPEAPPKEPEDEKPPPIPDKVLDENDNQPAPLVPGAGLQNGEINSPLSPSTGLENHQLLENELSAMYSSVVKPSAVEKENDYSSIAEINGLLPESSSSDLYATVTDTYQSVASSTPPGVQEKASEHTDPGYETIGILKAGDEGAGSAQRDPDYATVGELELGREISRL
ncbi:phosphoprotein associated with glycosphingolipid-enriched microdomains 1 [Megalops cyprinoides]|uniref:phosphoprotein associated with glycosphingolipid-enriched microdomains 1 n=1 Tax=Megalops cyprinoides TaxID=118141 RepID=UPI0018653D55|nr:phosphoprotein associated with glycosphingolipid-enriched microdomains 1 [Megalops cyprinoides]XP_036371451.1 phosphoprotein associated with glycosphingolipid-enriched microdomains 1 [Megalops cyprinoides]XP_036371452.1 phosphoprotein associated with glycosphingolipid-enriched microdomains 1 [Megalops cyprinoides]XP_036371453.1 phosphoprotein associated with glycosphingolipid-enriched microdomains 1 [Megalops cyprinoides]